MFADWSEIKEANRTEDLFTRLLLIVLERTMEDRSMTTRVNQWDL